MERYMRTLEDQVDINSAIDRYNKWYVGAFPRSGFIQSPIKKDKKKIVSRRRANKVSRKMRKRNKR